MHYHAEIWVPDGEDINAYISKVMEPHRENYDDARDELTGFWDWFQLGGRWTGVHTPGFDPSSDPNNIETCTLCNGTGFRMDRVGHIARLSNPTFTCNGCGKRDVKTNTWGHGRQGPGKSVKWPTDWARYDKDIIPVADINDDLECHTLIVGDNIMHRRQWNGTTFEDTDFDGRVKPMLDKLGITSGVLVTIDYHC